MINDKTLKQEGGKQSTNFQGQNVNVYHGITYADAKEIALDVFKANFIQLKSDAARIAAERAEEITESILNRLNDKSPEILDTFEQPAMQDALFTAQKEFAKSGDKDLGDLLVDIIIDRAGQPTRTMLQIILDESLLIAPKLMLNQLDTLTISFLLLKTKRQQLNSFIEFENYLKNYIFPFVDNLTSEDEHYTYLEYLRCGQIRDGSYSNLEDILRIHYKGFFSKGFEEAEIINIFGIETFDWFFRYKILTKCFHDDSKLQIWAYDEDELQEKTIEMGLSEHQKRQLFDLFERTTMSGNKIKALLIQFDARMGKIFEVWTNSLFRRFELSHVGIAIAHANYKRKTGEANDLSKWIK